VYWLTCLLIAGAVAASATTIILPSDEQLISKAPVIVSGTVLRSNAVQIGNKIWTETTLAVDHAFKGGATGEITIREVGGAIDGRITKVFGSAEYTAGERVLAFLAPTPRGDFQTIDLFAGKFSEERTLSGARIWRRDDVTADATLLDRDFKPIEAKNVQRDASGFEHFVTDRVAGRDGSPNYGIENPALERRIHPEFTLMSEPSIYRWFAFDRGSTVRWYSYGTQPGYTGGGVSEVQTAIGVWSGYSAALIRYTYAGAASGSPGSSAQSNGINEIAFNDPNQEIAGSWNSSSGGVVGLGGFNGVSPGGNWTSTFTADAAHTQGTFHAVEITEGFFTVQDGVSPSAHISSATLAEICAHELGHTLGLGHSSDSTALMYPSVTGLGASLRGDDQLAARWLYPNANAPNPGPTTPNPPSNLSASASGSTITLMWVDNATDEIGQYVYLATGQGYFSRIGDAGANHTTGRINGVAPGSYRIYVSAYNAAGESAGSNTVNVTIADTSSVPIVPSAAFVVSSMSGIAGSTTFAFTDQSIGTISTRMWSFGDGTSSTLTNPTHVYANAGNYTVILTVSGQAGQSQATRTLTVTAAVPALPNVQAAFDFTPPTPSAHDAVSFRDHSSGAPTAWLWAFGDGTTSSEQNPVHAYDNAGTYTIIETVYNSMSTSTATRAITVSAIAPYRSLVSASAQTDGAGGSAWRTHLTIFNSGSEAVTGQLVFLPGAGGNVMTRPLSLAPKQSLSWSNALQDIFGISSGAGAIAIEASSDASTPNLKLTSRTYTTTSGGTYGQAVPNVAPANLQPTLYLTGMESDAEFRTNLGMVNRTDAAVSAQMTLYDATGAIVGSTATVVAANSFQQAPLATYFPPVAERAFDALSMRVDLDVAGAVSVYASVIDNRTQDPIYVQGMGLPPGFRSVIPAVGRAPGANGTFWRSDVRLFNPTSTTISLTLRYRLATAPLTLAPNQTVTLRDVVSQLGAVNGTGALEVLWNGVGPVVTSRTYTVSPDGGTYGQSVDATQAFASDSYVPGLRSDNAFRSNVGFVNSSDDYVNVSATLLSPTGQAIATAYLQLGPRGQAQYSLGSLFQNIDVTAIGTVTLLAHTDGGAVLFAYGSLVDNVSGDPVFFAGQ